MGLKTLAFFAKSLGLKDLKIALGLAAFLLSPQTGTEPGQT